MKKVVVLLAFLVMVAGLLAAPAYPNLITFIQPDGSELEIYLKGDERVKWAETTDGYSILFNNDGFYEYATLNENNDMVPSGIRVSESGSRNQTEIDFLNRNPQKLFYSESQISMMKQIWDIYDKENTRAFPTTGNRKLICILIGFTDKAFTKTQADFNNLYNQVNYSTDGATGSVKDYYLENSYEQFNLTVDVAGPYTASNNMAYYGANDSSGNDLRPNILASEAVQLANSAVNYADYDNDNDGAVDGVYIIYAGYGEEAGGPANAIWAHAWSFSTITLDGKTLSRYSCSAELRGSSGTGLTRIGVICHEFGHVLGAPDYYDTNYATGGSYQGMSYWDLMASGSWNNGGATPAHHNGLTKVYFYNWAEYTLLTSGTTVTLQNSAQNSTSFYRYNTTTSNEYFFIENRQKVGFDGSLPGEGMMIHHVHSNFASGASSNSVNDTHPQMMYPVSQNATSDPTSTSSSYGTINSSTCPWNGTGKTTFSDTSTPSSKSWASANTSKPITNITRNTTNRTVTFDFMGGGANDEPTNFTATSISSSQINLSWTKNANRNVLLVYSTTGTFGVPSNGVNYTAGNSISGGGTVIYAGANQTYSHTGLASGSTYYYKIFTRVNSTPTWSSGVTANATTECGLVTSFPFTENFESAFLPECWDKIVASGNDITQSNTQNHTTGGTYSARFSSYSTSSDYNQYLFTPMMQLPANAELSFWHRKHGTQAEQLFYGVGTTKNPADYSWTEVSLSNTNWQESVASLSAYAGQNVYVAFKYYGNYLYYVYLDDVSVTATTVTEPSFSLSPSSLSFGNVAVGNSSTLQFTISNTGTAALTGNITTPTGYSVSAETRGTFSKEIKSRNTISYNIVAGGSSVFNLLFTPTSATSYNGNVTITSNDSAHPTNYLSVTGTGTVVTQPDIAINPTSITKSLSVDETSNENVAISNTGNATLTYSASVNYGRETRDVLINENFSSFPPTGWTTTGGTNWQGNASNSAGGTSPEARFNWSPDITAEQRLISKTVNTTGMSTVELEFKQFINNYSGDYELRVETSSNGSTWNTIATYPAADLAATTENITISNSDVGSSTFRVAFVFDGRSYNIDYWHIDDVLLEGTAGSTENWLTLNGTATVSGSVTAGNSTNITAGFDATGLAEGSYTANITVTSNDPDESPLNIPVTLTVSEVVTEPEISISPSSLAYGNVTVNTTSNKTFTISNTGTATLTGNISTPYNQYVVSEQSKESEVSFKKSGNDRNSISYSIAAGNSKTFNVAFTPTSVTSYNGNVVITSNDADEGTTNLGVTGSGIAAPAPEISISPSSLAYGNVTVNTTSNKTFTISNTGTATLTGNISTPFNQYVVSEQSKESEVSFIKSGNVRNSISYSITAGNSKTFNLAFTPTSVTSYNGNVVITSNDADEGSNNLAVTGSGEAVPTPDINVTPANITKTLETNQTGTENLQIANTGNASLTYSASVSYNSKSRATILSENFNASTNLPTGWQIVDNQGGGQNWVIGTHTNGLGGTPGNYAYLNSDGYGSGNTQNSDLISPAMNFSNHTNVTLTFTHYFRSYSGSSATLSYSVNGGSTWTSLQTWSATSSNPTSYNQVISALAGQSNVKFKWNYTGTWGYYWDVDDIMVTAEPESSSPEWLSLNGQSSVSGTINGGNNQNITVGFDAAGLANDTYEASIVITSNDPDENPVNVNVTMTISETSAPELTPTPYAVTKTMDIDETSTENIQLANAGSSAVSYSLAFTENRSKLERNITGSTVTCSATEFTPGETVTWTLSVHNASTDDEWLKDVFIDFPTGVTVNSATHFVGGTNGNLTYDNTTGNGAYVNWHGEDASGWGVIKGNETATATISVTISSSFTSQINLSYQINGDVYGSEPHVVNGTMTIYPTLEPLGWISVNPQSGTLAGYGSQNVQLSFNTNGLSGGEYSCNLVISYEGTETIVPITLNVVGTPSNVSRMINDGYVILYWEPVIGAITYRVYSSDNPFTGFTLDSSGELDLNSRGVTWTAPVGNAPKRFYYVTLIY